jgi:hypothetical protein
MTAALTQYCIALPLRQRRLVAVGVAFAALILFVGLVVWPVYALYTNQLEWRATASKTIAEARGAEPAIASVVQQLDALPASAMWAKLYTVDKVGTGAALLQADVASLVSGARGAVQSLTPLAAVSSNNADTKNSGDMARIGVRVVASMTIDQLKDFMSAMAAHTRYLRIEHLSVFAPSAQSPAQNPMMTVTMEVVGMEWVRSELATKSVAVERNASSEAS